MPLPDPAISRDGDEWIYTWPGCEEPLDKIAVGVNNLHESAREIYAEVNVEWVSDIGTGHVYGPRRFNLLGARTGSDLSRELVTRTQGRIDKDLWSSVVEKILHLTIEQYRQGDPTLHLGAMKEVGAVNYTIEGFMSEDDTTVIVADGGTGKGWLGVHTALCFATETPFRGKGMHVHNRSCPGVLYLDWEASVHETTRRFQWMARGMRLPAVPSEIHYRRMHRGISEEINSLRREAKSLNVGLVVIDSLGPAVADKLVAEGPAIKTMEDIRLFSPADRLVIAHMSKFEAYGGSGKAATIFGSVFYRNLCRSLWEMQSEEVTPEEYNLAMLHQKVNSGRKQAHFGLKLTFSDQTHEALISPGDFSEVTAAVGKETLAYRLRLALRNGAQYTKALAAELKTSEKAVRTLAGRDDAILRLPSSEKQALWGLREEPGRDA